MEQRRGRLLLLLLLLAPLSLQPCTPHALLPVRLAEAAALAAAACCASTAARIASKTRAACTVRRSLMAARASDFGLIGCHVGKGAAWRALPFRLLSAPLPPTLPQGSWSGCV